VGLQVARAWSSDVPGTPSPGSCTVYEAPPTSYDLRMSSHELDEHQSAPDNDVIAWAFFKLMAKGLEALGAPGVDAGKAVESGEALQAFGERLQEREIADPETFGETFGNLAKWIASNLITTLITGIPLGGVLIQEAAREAVLVLVVPDSEIPTK
jgi:hypothetical protein